MPRPSDQKRGLCCGNAFRPPSCTYANKRYVGHEGARKEREDRRELEHRCAQPYRPGGREKCGGGIAIFSSGLVESIFAACEWRITPPLLCASMNSGIGVGAALSIQYVGEVITIIDYKSIEGKNSCKAVSPRKRPAPNFWP